MLEAKELVVVRAGRRIVDGAYFAVKKHEIAVVQGPSGGGKTTFLRALATLIAFDSGTLELDGKDARALSPRSYRTRVAYVPQQAPMLDGSVAKNLAAGPGLRGITLAPKILDALLDRAGLDARFRDRPARDLSGGEKQRVALARALANEPEVLLLDEPTASLDPTAAKHVLAMAASLANAGLAVVVVTHIEEHAASLHATRYVCEEGKLRAGRGEA